jgi:hypothetical protein
MKIYDLTAFLIRLSVGFVLFSAGFSKLAPDQIGNLIGPVFMPFESESMILITIWYSVALVEIFGGALLLSQKYSMPGLLLSYLTFAGILLFTIIAGFGLTILVNFFFLMLLSIEVAYNRHYIKLISLSDYSTFLKSRTAEMFPGNTFTMIGSILTIFAIPLSFFNDVLVNIVVSIAVISFVINMFSGRELGFIGKLFITMFFIVSLSVVNGLYLKAFVPNLIYWIFGFIGVGMVCYGIIAGVAIIKHLIKDFKRL